MFSPSLGIDQLHKHGKKNMGNPRRILNHAHVRMREPSIRHYRHPLTPKLCLVKCWQAPHVMLKSLHPQVMQPHFCREGWRLEMGETLGSVPIRQHLSPETVRPYSHRTATHPFPLPYHEYPASSASVTTCSPP